MWVANNRGEMVWVNNDHEYTMTVASVRGGGFFQTYEESYAVDNAIWGGWEEALGCTPKKKCIFDE